MYLNKNKKIILLICVLGVFLLVGVKSLDLNGSYELAAGKNVVNLSGINPFYVADLVKLNPEIEVVSFVGGENVVGYVNVFGGIGDNFPVRDGTYEIIVSEDITLDLPNDE